MMNEGEFRTMPEDDQDEYIIHSTDSKRNTTMLHQQLLKQLERIVQNLPDNECRCCGKSTTIWSSMADGRPLHTQCMGKHARHSKGIRAARCREHGK